jgi:hypothetical protein
MLQRAFIIGAIVIGIAVVPAANAAPSTTSPSPALLKAVRRGDVERAQSLVTEHLRAPGELLHRVLGENAEVFGSTGAAETGREQGR